MTIYRLTLLTLSLLIMSACVDENSLTAEEIEIQNKATAAVTEILFNHEVDSAASYNIRKDGFVVIHFDPAV